MRADTRQQPWRVWSWLRLDSSCSNFWICCGEHRGACTGENCECFDGWIIGNEAVNWVLCGWMKLAGRWDAASLDCWGWEWEEDCLRAGVWWKGLSKPPLIGQGREREDMNEQECPATKVLQIDYYVGSFILYLMEFWWGRGMTKHYWMLCDHEMLGYCAIFKGLGQLKLLSRWRGNNYHYRVISWWNFMTEL
jgi:hypothetical protein